MTLKFDAYAAISHFTKRQMTRFYGINDGKIKVICPGIDYALFDKSKYDKAESRQKLGLDGHAFYYLYFGRPGWAKGLEYLLAAVPKIAQKIPNSKLVLILSPTPKTNHRSLIKLAKKLGAEDKIVILKSVSRENLPRYIAAADCAVCPSISEGFGFMVAESCAMGIPVATTDAGSLPEVAGGKVVFVKTKDSASLADGVCHVAKGHWQEIPSKKFLWSDAIQFYEKMYAETIERFSAARSGRRS